MTDTLTQGPEITGEEVKADMREDRTNKVLDAADQASAPEAPATMTETDQVDIDTMNAAPEATDPRQAIIDKAHRTAAEARAVIDATNPKPGSQEEANILNRMRQDRRSGSIDGMTPPAPMPEVQAAAPVTEAPVETPAATTEAPAPEAKKPGFFKRLFGGKA